MYKIEEVRANLNRVRAETEFLLKIVYDEEQRKELKRYLTELDVLEAQLNTCQVIEMLN